MLGDTLERAGRVRRTQVRDQDLDLAIATTAHELKEPIVGVRAALERVAAADGDPGGQHELLLRSCGELERLSDLVDPLLRWSAGSGQLSLRPTDLVELVDGAVASCSLGDEEGQVVVRAPRELWLRVDPVELLGAVANLVRNALAYSPDGCPVTVTVASNAGGASISVRDRGPGVGADEGGRIFDPFARGRVGIEGRAGKGLGLFIARRVVEAHGGSIELRPNADGAEFSIVLPSIEEGSRSAS
jgi:signal transduction histidine kinase